MDIQTLDKRSLKKAARWLEKEVLKYTVELKQVPPDSWPEQARDYKSKLINLWRSRFYVVQEFEEGDGFIRISITRTTIDVKQGRWRDGITWDQIQAIKSEIGFGDRDAFEIYPSDLDTVNVANVRHLWILPEGEKLKQAWRKNE